MADTFVKKPMVVVGTKDQVVAEMGANDFGVATDVSFYTAEETDAKLSGKQDKGDYATNTALAQKQDIATAVNYDNITNCITEIPQDIKLELSSGTLTLKAGSKVYVPNGPGVFNAYTLPSDKGLTISNDDKYMICLRANGSSLTYNRVSGQTGSGTTTPTSSYWTYYNTADNKVYLIQNGVNADQLSLPICVVTVSGGTISSIDQVFNGFGHIGNSVFALPRTSGLVPNGRNADGTLKNTTWTCSSVITRTFGSETRDVELGFDGGSFSRLILSQRSTYDRFANVNLNPADNPPSKWLYTSLATCTLTAGVISNFNIKTVFRALDYNDREYIAHQAMPSDIYVDLTLGTSGATYTMPADGYLYFAKTSVNADEYVYLTNVTCLFEEYRKVGATERTTINIPVSKGDVIKISYTLSGSTNAFRFVYANGAK